MEINIQEILDIEEEIGQAKFGQSYEKMLRTNLFPVTPTSYEYTSTKLYRLITKTKVVISLLRRYSS